MATTFVANPFVVILGAGDTWSPPAKCRVLDAVGVMIGAGATSDTWKITDGTNDITAAVDVSSASDKDRSPAGSIDDAHYDLIPGTDTLTHTVASAAAVIAVVTLAWIA